MSDNDLIIIIIVSGPVMVFISRLQHRQTENQLIF